jgi:hypothetical protein
MKLGVTPGSADRRAWPVRTFHLGAEPGDDLSATTTPEARLAMMWPLTQEAWGLSGRPMPAYGRAETPVGLRRRE